MTLGVTRSPLGNTTRLINSARTMNRVARIVVVLLKKSDVLRTPNTVPMLPPPKDPASPPPLLACMRTTIVSRTLTTISIIKKNVYIRLSCEKENPAPGGTCDKIPTIRQKSNTQSKKSIPLSFKFKFASPPGRESS